MFELTVIQFGMTKAPVDFHGYINTAIKVALDDVALANMDDILIYSNSEEEHDEHVEWAMQCLLEAEIDWKPENSEFHKKTLKNICLIISTYKNS